MWNQVRIAGTSSGHSILRKVMTTVVALGLAASFTLGAAPVSAAPAQHRTFAGFSLSVTNIAPQWGDLVTLGSLVDWGSCKRVPSVSLVGTSASGESFSEPLVGVKMFGKTYLYLANYGGTIEGMPYDSSLTQAERSALGDRRLPSGWNEFYLKATSTTSNCGQKTILSAPATFYVGPAVDGITLTTNATHTVNPEYTTGLISLSPTDEAGSSDFSSGDFTAGIYQYEATSQAGDSVSASDMSSGTWIQQGEIIGDTLSVDVTEHDDANFNPSGVNCYLDSPVTTTGDPVTDGHHEVDDATALDCAQIDLSGVGQLGEHVLTIERWIDSCDSGCLSWTTYTVAFARVENRDAVPYQLDLLDASTGDMLTVAPFTVNPTDNTSGNTINLGADFSNGIEIAADVPFGAELSCSYDGGAPLSAGDIFDPSTESGVTYLVCTVTPESGDGYQFTYTVAIHRTGVYSNYFTALRVNGDMVRDDSSGIGDSTSGITSQDFTGNPEDASADWYYRALSATATATVTWDWEHVPDENTTAVCEISPFTTPRSCSGIPLSNGQTTEVHVVVSVDSVAVQTYVVHVYRVSNDKTLSALSATGGRTLTPSFSSGTLSYTARLGAGDSFAVDYTTGNEFATADCSAATGAETGIECNDIPTDSGPVVATITVTAENGDTQDYVIRFTNGPAPAYVARAKLVGLNKVGKTLSASVGVWRFHPTFTYRWFYCSSSTIKPTTSTDLPGFCGFSGITTATWKLPSWTNGYKIVLEITATNTNGSYLLYTAATPVIKAQ